jgi:hypothetical protein
MSTAIIIHVAANELGATPNPDSATQSVSLSADTTIPRAFVVLAEPVVKEAIGYAQGIESDGGPDVAQASGGASKATSLVVGLCAVDR